MLLHLCNHLADTVEVETVALDAVVEEPVEAEMSPRAFKFDSTKTGIEGCICSNWPLLVSRTTTSDIVGLIAADA